MRIIDKNHDYYDYLQDPTDDTLIFDRRGSFLLEKSKICQDMYLFEGVHGIDTNFKFIELQCGASFWIFLATITKFSEVHHHIGKEPIDFDLELLATWKNYNKPNKLLDINLISTTHAPFYRHDWKTKTWNLERKNITTENVKRWFEEGQRVKNIGTLRVSTSKKHSWDDKEYTIPLLNATGIANIVPAIDMFCAIEEYFSREKTASERTEAIGTTNNDKITMHGFDLKTSFRGKQ